MKDTSPDLDAQSQSEARPDLVRLLEELLEQARRQTDQLAALASGPGIDTCLLDKIGRITCLLANETHHNGKLLASIAESMAALLAMYRGAHPDQALQLDRLAKLEADLRRCCPPPHQSMSSASTSRARRTAASAAATATQPSRAASRVQSRSVRGTSPGRSSHARSTRSRRFRRSCRDRSSGR